MGLRHKKEKKEKHYDEGYVRGRRALMIGIFPIFIFLGTMVFGAWMIVDYYNKITVNQDNSDACKLVRNHYPASIKATYPCGLTDKDTYWIVSFNESVGSTGAPVYMSFKVDKSTNAISPAVDVR